MNLGMIGLGRMGANMAQRLRRDNHRVVGFDHGQESRTRSAQNDIEVVASLQALVDALPAPRTVWMMVPAGSPVEATIGALQELLVPNDILIDGGNSNYKDTMVRAKALAAQRIHYVDVGTSGGVWGLEVGYCMMVGGPDDAVGRLAPFLDVLAPHPTEEHGPSDGRRPEPVAHLVERDVDRRTTERQGELDGPVVGEVRERHADEGDPSLPDQRHR